MQEGLNSARHDALRPLSFVLPVSQGLHGSDDVRRAQARFCKGTTFDVKSEGSLASVPHGEWRRLYPIRYRHLAGESQFSRWDILAFAARPATTDPRSESRRVEENTLRVVGHMKSRERGSFFDPLFRPSIADAASRGESLTLVRPRGLRFRWRPKRPEEIEDERAKIAAASAQGSLLDAPLTEFEPCPMHLAMAFEDDAGKHVMMCGDWETSATYWKWTKLYGEAEALTRLKDTYEQRYADAGVALALGTVAKRPKQWLLLGVLRMDETSQPLLV
jgi:hypothetical protein